MEIPRLNVSPVVFNGENHTYQLGDKYLKGITSTLIRRAYPNTYSVPEGMTNEQWSEILKNAAKKGTAIHQAIELYEDLGVKGDMPEVQNYIHIKEDNGFMNIATEYIVSDEENYASAIDHVWYHTETDEIVIVDIKRTSEVHIDEVTCQTSIYKYLFIRQNPHLKDRKIRIALLWLRDKKSEFRLLSPLADEVVEELIDSDIKDKPFNIQEAYGELPVKFADVEEQIANLDAEIKAKKAKYDELKNGLFELMNEHGIQKFTGNSIMLTISKPSKRESFDVEAFKADHKELYEEYKTCIEIRPSLRITIKKNK